MLEEIPKAFEDTGGPVDVVRLSRESAGTESVHAPGHIKVMNVVAPCSGRR